MRDSGDLALFVHAKGVGNHGADLGAVFQGHKLRRIRNVQRRRLVLFSARQPAHNLFIDVVNAARIGVLQPVGESAHPHA